jgi:lipoprotein-releasing system ATP-binding protein
MSSKIVMELREIERTYNVQSSNPLHILRSANLSVKEGEIVALVGPSGSGKSTLLHIAGLLEKPDSGAVFINGEDVTGFSDRERTLTRRDALGFVYQHHHLLPEFSALENIVIPQYLAGKSKAAALDRAKALLAQMNLSERENHRPAQLSGGEQQRVAIARALANEPQVLLADEPTGNLDPKTAERIFNGFIDLVRSRGLAAIIATHNFQLATKMDRAILISEGQLVDGQELVRE